MNGLTHQLLVASIEVTLVALVVAIASCLVGRKRARLRAWLWLLVPLKASLVFLPISGGPIHLSVPDAMTLSSPSAQAVSVTADAAVLPALNSDAISQTQADALPALRSNDARPRSVWNWILPVWLIGFLSALAWNIYGRAQLRRLRRSSLRPTEDLIRIYGEETGRYGLAAPPRLIVHDGPVGPLITFGMRPALVLPHGLVAPMNPSKLRWILRHELTHIRHFDHISMVLWTLVRMVYWFHPVIWWAHRQWRHAMEQACDDAVADSPPEAKRYAAALYAVLRDQLSPPIVNVSNGSLAATRTEVGRRIERLLKRGTMKPGKPARMARVGWVAGLVAVGLFSLESKPLEFEGAQEDRSELRLDFGPDDQRVEPGWDGWSGDKDRDFTCGFDLDFEIEIDRGPAWRDSGVPAKSMRSGSLLRDGLRERDDDSIRIRLKDLDAGDYLLELYCFNGSKDSTRAPGRFNLVIDGQVMLADQVTSRGESLSGASLPPISLSSDGDEVVVELERTEGEIWLNGLTLSAPTRWSGDLRLGKIDLSDAPAGVQATVKRELGTAILDDVRRRERNDELVYSIDADTPDGDLELEIAPDGMVLERSEEIQPDRLPIAVREALRTMGESLEIRKAVHFYDSEQQVYRVDVRIDGEKTRLIYGADGKLQE